MRLILLGAPGSGKGTQGRRLAAHFGVPHIASGDLLRDHVARRTELGLAMSAYLDRGDLVPDDVVISIVAAEVVAAARAGGYVLDGYPRTLAQAQEAYRLAEAAEVTAEAALYLEVPDDVARARLLGRAESRTDDRAGVAARRLAVFHEQTEPLLDYYAERGILVRVDGNRPPDDVFSSALEALAG